jgi:threonine dehydrogenase-like Zn-dependent dehydrogenase
MRAVTWHGKGDVRVTEVADPRIEQQTDAIIAVTSTTICGSDLGVDRMAALHTAIGAVRRGGTVSVVGVYGGAVDPMPMMTMFDKGITIRMAHVKRWIDDIMPLLLDDSDPLGTEDLATRHLPLEDAPGRTACSRRSPTAS